MVIPVLAISVIAWKNLLHELRGEAQARLVEQKELRRAHQRARDGEHLLLAARKRPAVLAQPLPEAREETYGALEALLDARRFTLQVAAEPEVLFDAQVAEDGASFRDERHAEASDSVSPHPDHFAIEDLDAARSRFHELNDGLQRAGLDRRRWRR